MPVVKTFGQTVFSFKRFKDSIHSYEKWVIAYTKGLRLPMMFYTTAINGVDLAPEKAQLLYGILYELLGKLTERNNTYMVTEMLKVL